MKQRRVITTIGTTPVVSGEGTDGPDIGAWQRALAHSEAKARQIAAAIGEELGDLTHVEEMMASADIEPEVSLRVTYVLGSVVLTENDTGEAPREEDEATDRILEHVNSAVRPIYREFRQRLLDAHPGLRPVAAPLRKGKRRYEGFRVGSRNVIYAGFRKTGVRLMFELPQGPGLLVEGGRDSRAASMAGRPPVFPPPDRWRAAARPGQHPGLCSLMCSPKGGLG